LAHQATHAQSIEHTRAAQSEMERQIAALQKKQQEQQIAIVAASSNSSTSTSMSMVESQSQQVASVSSSPAAATMPFNAPLLLQHVADVAAQLSEQRSHLHTSQVCPTALAGHRDRCGQSYAPETSVKH
jgi:hypothetical protein